MAEEPKQTSPPQSGAAEPEAQDGLNAADRSLAHALRLSFVILTIVISGLILLFLARGFFTVRSHEMGLIVRFGVTDESKVRGPGSFYYAFPYPIDEVVMVDCAATTMDVNTFWPKTKEEAKTEMVEGKEDIPTEDVVKDAGDGFLLTGDKNIVESRWIVVYAVGQKDPSSIVKHYNMFGADPDRVQEKLLVRMALESAVVREVGGMLVDHVLIEERDAVAHRVRKSVEKIIEDLDCGILIKSVKLPDIVPPKPVRPSFAAKNEATQMKNRLIVEAQKKAKDTLIAAIGAASGRRLMELIRTVRKKGEEETWDWLSGKANEQIGKIMKSQAARKKARDVLDKAIIEVLKDKDAWGGRAKTILEDAAADAAAIVRQAERDAKEFEEVRKQHDPKAQEVYLDRFRIDALEEVLKQAYEVFVLHPAERGTDRTLELIMNRRPEILREQKKTEETR